MTKNKMSKYEFIKLFAKKLGVSQALAEQIIETYQETILESLQHYDYLKIGDIISIERKETKEQSRVLNGNLVTTPSYTYLKAKMTQKYKKFEGDM